MFFTSYAPHNIYLYMYMYMYIYIYIYIYIYMCIYIYIYIYIVYIYILYIYIYIFVSVCIDICIKVIEMQRCKHQTCTFHVVTCASRSTTLHHVAWSSSPEPFIKCGPAGRAPPQQSQDVPALGDSCFQVQVVVKGCYVLSELPYGLYYRGRSNSSRLPLKARFGLQGQSTKHL